MAHMLHRATLTLQTPLGTPLTGDTLFGQMCWALRALRGNDMLVRHLEGYTAGAPWLVISDGFPAGYLPKPALPQHFEPLSDPVARKAAKRKHWIPAAVVLSGVQGVSLNALLGSAVDDSVAYAKPPVAATQAHNTLNRLTGTTGEGEFAPYTTPAIFHAPGQRIDLYLVLDDARTTAAEVSELLSWIGASGFGRDASAGLGKFTLEGIDPVECALPGGANAYWTLAPCSPGSGHFDRSRSYWRVLTRFGRHGNLHALGTNPFKTPILMANTGAVLTVAGEFTLRAFVGAGIGGDGTLSKVEPGTVHQGYAPVLPLAVGDSP